MPSSILPNKWKSRVSDFLEEITAKTWRCVGHIASQDSSIWILKTLQWRRRETKRRQARPQRRCMDDVQEIAGKNWMRQARDGQTLKSMEQAYIQQYMNHS